jgi:ferredoxin
MQPMNEVAFETALGEHVEEMLDACTRCGKCVEVCPSACAVGQIQSGLNELGYTIGRE